MNRLRMAPVVATVVTLSIAGGCFNRNIGFALGSPSGLSYSQDLFNDRLAFGLGWTFFDGDGPQVHVDWIRHTSERLPGTASAYWGLGYRYRDRNAATADDARYESGLRIPFGIVYLPSSGDIDVFAEAAPGADFVAPGLTFDLSLGMRVAF